MSKDRIVFYVNDTKYDVRAKKGETETQLAVRADRKKREIESGLSKINKNMTVKKWADEWLETYKRPTVDETTYKDYKTRMKNWIFPVCGKMRLCDVKPIHAQKVLNGMIGCSKNRIDKVNYTMKALFEQAIYDGLININPAVKLNKPLAEDGTHRAITDKERDVILKIAETHRAGVWVKFMLYCGLRPQETAAIKWRNVDLINNKLKIDLALKANGAIGSPKSKASIRTIPIPNIFASNLKELKGNPFDFILTNKNGKRLTHSSMQKMWKSIAREMHIVMGGKIYRNEVVPPFMVADDLVPYCLRHTYCTDLQAAGVPINVAKEFMGHSDISITAKIYTHYSEDAFAAAAKAINNKISGKQKVKVKKLKRKSDVMKTSHLSIAK